MKTGIHPPKTPVTEGSHGVAKATLPNVCKMPGPPAPFVPSPLPNAAKSGSSPQGYSTSVSIEGSKVAIRGATFESMGDMASKGTGGGLISANTHGPAKFITPGSPTVKIEGKAVHLLGEPMLNNCGPSGSPPNTGSTLPGEDQGDQQKPPPFVIDINCKEKLASGDDKDKCDVQEFCAKVKALNDSKRPKKRRRPSPSNRYSEEDLMEKHGMTQGEAKAFRTDNNDYGNGIRKGRGWSGRFAKKVRGLGPILGPDSQAVKDSFYHPCRHEEWKANGASAEPKRGLPDGLAPDHVHDVGLDGPCNVTDAGDDAVKWMGATLNNLLGKKMDNYNPPDEHGDLAAHPDCQCE